MIDDPTLLNFLQREESRATDTTLNDERKTALEFYRGDLFGDEVDGRSKLRTRDVAEVVDYMGVSVLRTLVSGDKIVEFEPLEQGQDELAQQATERVHWNFMREQDGYMILHDGIKAGLLEKTGVWKSWVERPRTVQAMRLNTAQIEQIEAGDGSGAKIVRIKAIDDLYDVDETTGEPLQVFDAMVSVPGEPVFRDAAIPNDEFFVAPDARTLDAAIYVGNISRVALADLIEMGYTEADVSDLWGDVTEAQQLRDARDANRSEREDSVVRTDLSRQVVLREEYARCMFQGDYQLIRVHRVSSKILSAEPVAEQPYTLWCPYPMQHRLVGQSLADKTMDIQVVRSHMLRQAMDALYIANAPRMYIDMTQCDDVTLDDALDVAPGGIIRGKGPNAVTPFTQPFAAGNAFEAMEIMAGERESRTGITRLNQGLDADALNKTATGTALMQASGQQIEEYIARNAANAIAIMFQKKAALMNAAMAPHQFKIDGEHKQIDPAQWPQNMRVVARVGLGSGSKERKLQSMQVLAQAMADARELDPRMVGPQQGFEAAKELTSALGLGLATRFFNDPAKFPQQEGQQPDPAMIEAQAKMAAHQQEMQMKAQQHQQELEYKYWSKRMDMELDAATTAEEAELARERMFEEMRLQREKIMFQTAAKVSMPQQRPGGSLAA